MGLRGRKRLLHAFALAVRTGHRCDWGAWREAGMGARPASPHPCCNSACWKRLGEWSTRASSRTTTMVAFRAQTEDRQGVGPGNGLHGDGCRGLRGAAPWRPMEFQGVFFLAPFAFRGSEIKEVRVRLRRDREAGRRNERATVFSVIARAGEWTEHAAWPYMRHACRGQRHRWKRSVIMARCHDREILFDEEAPGRGGSESASSARWRCLRRMPLGKQ